MSQTFISLKELPLQELIPGGYAGSVHTENLTMAFTDLKEGTEVPLHQHHEEAIDVVLSGRLEMEIGGETLTLEHGMISLVASNIPHRAKAITDCRVVTVFYPRRNF